MLSTLSISKAVPLTISSFLEQFYEINQQAKWLLDFQDNQLILKKQQNQFSFSIDFNAGNYRHRNQSSGKEPLLHAIKVRGKFPEKIIDATPGVLKDSFLMASKGIQIIAIERNPLIYSITKQALLQTNASIELVFGNAQELIKNYSSNLIYIDPMYPPRKKAALVKKDMQILQDIVGVDSDSTDLIRAAINSNTRIVVKRPNYAKPLADLKPNLTSRIGNSTRFDIYLPR